VTRTTGSKGENTLKALRVAGINRLYKQGFSGMTLRELAGDVGIQAGSLYNYFSNKQDFLYEILRQVMLDVIGEMEVALDGEDNPRLALLAYVECHVSFHSSRQQEVLVSTTELRSLNPENYKRVTTLRDSYEGRLREILEWGNAEEYWTVIDPQVSSKLILGMMTSVGTWYSAGGRYQISDLVKIYQTMIENLLFNDMAAANLSPAMVS